MTTIYVRTTGNDTTGNGTTGTPYLTVKKALTVAAGGDLILIGDGTYAEDSGAGLLAIPNTSYTGRLTIAPESGVPDKVTITGTSAVYAMTIGTAAHLYFDAITFQAQASATTAAVRFIGDCSDITFTRCTFLARSVVGSTALCVTTAWVTGGWTPDTVVFTGCTFGQIGPYAAGGIVLDTGAAAATDIEIRDCDFRMGNFGIRMLGITNARIRGNRIDCWSPLVSATGIALGTDGPTGPACSGDITGNYVRTLNGHATLVGAGASGVLVADNRFYGGTNASAGQGLVIKEAQNVRVENNLITSGYLSGLYFKAAVDCQAIGNRIYNEHANSPAIRVGVNSEDSLPCQRLTVRRNYVHAVAGPVLGWEAAAGDSGGSVCDENVYVTTGSATLGSVRGATVSTLSGLRAAWSGYDHPNNDRHSRLGATSVPYGGVPHVLLP